jgi:hypothetical protein
MYVTLTLTYRRQRTVKSTATDERNKSIVGRGDFYAVGRNIIRVVEAESNTTTVGLRVVGDDEKTSLESETIKYGRESHRTRTPD